jgi:hypothetical protein
VLRRMILRIDRVYCLGSAPAAKEALFKKLF